MIAYLLSTTVDDAAGSMIFPNDKTTRKPLPWLSESSSEFSHCLNVAHEI
jgi:hypothetical protein